jgi:protein required for attachment to host cells
MEVTWVGVVNQSELKIFHRLPNGDLKHLKTLRNRLSRLADRQLSRPPRPEVDCLQSVQNESSQECAVSAFAARIGRFLENSRSRQQFSELLLIADPRLAVAVRNAMSSGCLNSVKAWIQKNLQAATSHEVIATLVLEMPTLSEKRDLGKISLQLSRS